jgi:hypothetical protein
MADILLDTGNAPYRAGDCMQFSMLRLSNLMQFSAAARPDAANFHDGDSDGSAGIMQQVFDGFRLNQNVINYIQQMIHLLADIQRHRACSLAILSGNLSFDAMATSLERKIRARLVYLDSQTDLTEVIDQYEWDNVLNEWNVVGYGWRQDNMQHNFELHSHLVEKILNIVRDAGRWVLRSGSYSEDVANHYLGHQIFEFIFAQHLYQTETLGKLRGLGSCISHSGNITDNTLRMRIEFLLQCAKQEQAASQILLTARAATISRYIPAMIDIQRTVSVFQEWVAVLTDLVQGKTEITEAVSQQVFDLASAVIDARLLLTEQVLAYLQLAMEEMLETLLEETSRQ